ncbi:uncharacterized protein LOC113336817 [Papaver somniferum]|uniref:uncharacterized protein LOC113336817 n=1 Tax=Papaver somniferum TaxID=3469 RepID=UPI000E6F65AC|nr:uncharacterized protein LOC113336817 [Papaver somniferum]
MGIKIDMAKAFDRVNSEFLMQVMQQMGFSTQWCNLVHQCISTTTMVVLVNGSPGKFFKPTRGLGQGDPLSPYLFLFCMEALSRYLTAAEAEGLIHGTKICSEAPNINHLVFADDCMIFCKANLEECNNLIKIFQDFGHSSGQLINFSKSGIFFSKNTDPSIADSISDTMKVQRIDTSDKYLGSPLFTNRSKIQAFKPGVNKLKLRLAGWKSTLSTAGKVTMIKTITSTSNIYQMNCFKLLKGTCKEINNIQRNFFWNKDQDKPKGLFYIAWDAVNKPKGLGGLGFKNMEYFNLAMISKIAWRLIEEPHSLWTSTMKASHFPNKEVIIMETKPKNTDSWIWKGILEGITCIQKYYIWKIGDGTNIHIWEDRWIEDLPDILQKPLHCPSNLETVNQLFNTIGEWDHHIISLWFPQHIQQLILQTHHHPNSVDTIQWSLTHTKKFTVKSLYDKQIEDKYAGDTLTAPWGDIWKLDTNPAIQLFIWKCAHGILPKNAKSAGILTYIDPLCNICKCANEDITHVLLACPAASDVWRNLFGWFSPDTTTTSWNSSYATICWFIWKARCDKVFRHIEPNAAATALKITQHLCSHDRVLNKPSHILNNIYYQANNVEDNLSTHTRGRQLQEKFGITISIHIMEAYNTLANGDGFQYTNFALVALSFSYQCMGARNVKDPAIGLSRSSRACRGAQLALTWGKEMKNTNINFEAEEDDILQAVHTAYKIAVQQWFQETSLIEDRKLEVIDFVLGNLTKLDSQRQNNAAKLARIATTSLLFQNMNWKGSNLHLFWQTLQSSPNSIIQDYCNNSSNLVRDPLGAMISSVDSQTIVVILE